MNTCILFALIFIALDITHASWKFITSEEELPSWYLDSPWHYRNHRNLEETYDPRLHWNFLNDIKTKLHKKAEKIIEFKKGKFKKKKKKKKKKKAKKKKGIREEANDIISAIQEIGKPLLSANFLLQNEEPAALITQVTTTTTTTTTTTEAPTTEASPALESASEEDPKTPVSEEKNPDSDDSNEKGETNDDDEDENENEKENENENDDNDDDDEEDDEDEDDVNDDDEDENSEEESDDKGHHKKGIKKGHHPEPAEPVDIDSLGTKADLYLRFNKAYKNGQNIVKVVKGVYVDYVKHRPYFGLEIGHRSSERAEPVHSVMREGRKELSKNYYIQTRQIPFPNPRYYCSSYKCISEAYKSENSATHSGEETEVTSQPNPSYNYRQYLSFSNIDEVPNPYVEKYKMQPESDSSESTEYFYTL